MRAKVGCFTSEADQFPSAMINFAFCILQPTCIVILATVQHSTSTGDFALCQAMINIGA